MSAFYPFERERTTMPKYRIEFECEPAALDDQLNRLAVEGFSDVLQEVDPAEEQAKALAACKFVWALISESIQDDLICLLDSQFGEVEYVNEVKDMACAIVVSQTQEKLNTTNFATAFCATSATAAKATVGSYTSFILVFRPHGRKAWAEIFASEEDFIDRWKNDHYVASCFAPCELTDPQKATYKDAFESVSHDLHQLTRLDTPEEVKLYLTNKNYTGKHNRGEASVRQVAIAFDWIKDEEKGDSECL